MVSNCSLELTDTALDILKLTKQKRCETKAVKSRSDVDVSVMCLAGGGAAGKVGLLYGVDTR